MWPRQDPSRAMISAGFNGEQCPGCAGIVRDYCDACAFGRTRHILDAGPHSLCLCERCFSRFGKKCGPKLQPVNPRPRVVATPPLGPVRRRSRMGTTPSTQPASPLFENAASTSVLPLWFINMPMYYSSRRGPYLLPIAYRPGGVVWTRLVLPTGF